MATPTQTERHVALFEKCRNFTRAREVQAMGLYPYFTPIQEKGTRCPAALVELEFISNPGVERQLGQSGRQQELAAAVAEAARAWAMQHLR